ncbi:MAG TPA: 3-oxoadipate enol-lactonase [Streptosporangiaceae bacterium]
MSDQAASLVLTGSLTGPDGAPALVLGNSLGTSRAVWDAVIPALAGRYRLLRFELPGHGGAPSPPGPYTVGQLGAGVTGLLDRHGIERADYLGISLGGMIGMWLAAHAPDRIGALGLVCTSAYLPPAQGWLDRADLVRARGMTAVRQQSLGRWFPPLFVRREPALTEAFGAELERIDPDGYAGCCAAIARMDLREVLSAIGAPALVIAGTQDPATPPDHAARIASGIAGARLLVVRGAGHLATVTHPAETGAALAAHLAGATGRSA